MPTAIGTNVVTALARHYILPDITDNVYRSNPLFFRLNGAGKRQIHGGTQLEVPQMYKRKTNGGSYQGYDPLNVAPNDTIKSLAFDWKQMYSPVTVDGLTLIRTDSPDAIANFLTMQFQQTEMDLCDLLGTGIWSDGTDAKDIDGIETAVDAGSVATTYGGLTRSSNTHLNAKVDSSTATLTLAALQSIFGQAGEGGRQVSLICSRQEQYNRYWALVQAGQRFPVAAGGHDEQLASAGFTNLLFNNTPWVVDSHVFDGPNTSNSAVVGLNEDFINFGVSPRADFYLEDFQKPVNQDAYVSMLLWAGNLMFSNTQRQFKMTNVSA